MTQSETELLNWMIDFYKKCRKFEKEFVAKDYKRYTEYKEIYKELKQEIRDKYHQVSKIKIGKEFKDEGFLNRCSSNIGESAAWGFTEKSNSNNFVNLFNSVEEGSYKISKFMTEYSDQFDSN